MLHGLIVLGVLAGSACAEDVQSPTPPAAEQLARQCFFPGAAVGRTHQSPGSFTAILSDDNATVRLVWQYYTAQMAVDAEYAEPLFKQPNADGSSIIIVRQGHPLTPGKERVSLTRQTLQSELHIYVEARDPEKGVTIHVAASALSVILPEAQRRLMEQIVPLLIGWAVEDKPLPGPAEFNRRYPDGRFLRGSIEQRKLDHVYVEWSGGGEGLQGMHWKFLLEERRLERLTLDERLERDDLRLRGTLPSTQIARFEVKEEAENRIRVSFVIGLVSGSFSFRKTDTGLELVKPPLLSIY